MKSILNGITTPFLTATALLVLAGCKDDNNSGGGGVFGNISKLPAQSLTFTAPEHFLSANVEANYPTKRAIPKVSVINKKAGASVTMQTHPANPNAQLRVITLPLAIKASEDYQASNLLAESGALQDCDVIVAFRPKFHEYNAYCNVQLGLTHSAMIFIEEEGGGKYAHSVENPIYYSSRLTYEEMYGGLYYFHIVRPVLTSTQKKNVIAWMKATEATPHKGANRKIFFQGNYNKPYSGTNSLSYELARTVLYPDQTGTLNAYCSELVWAILGLRDVSLEEMKRQFPNGSDPGLAAWLSGKITPFFGPLPAATQEPMANPGLVQGPDVQMRNLLSGDNEARYEYLLDKVLSDESLNPSATGLSSGHRQAAALFKKGKLPALRSWYSPNNEDPALLGSPSSQDPRMVNSHVVPNYSPTSFFVQANTSGEGRKFNYVGTVAFQ